MNAKTLDELKLDIQQEIDILNTLLSTAQRELRYNSIEITTDNNSDSGFSLTFKKTEKEWIMFFVNSNGHETPIMECPLDIKIMATNRVHELFKKKRNYLESSVLKIRAANNFMRDSLRYNVL